MKDLKPGELVIAPEVEARLGTVEVYTGPGKRVQDDRVLIKVRSKAFSQETLSLGIPRSCQVEQPRTTHDRVEVHC